MGNTTTMLSTYNGTIWYPSKVSPQEEEINVKPNSLSFFPYFVIGIHIFLWLKHSSLYHLRNHLRLSPWHHWMITRVDPMAFWGKLLNRLGQKSKQRLKDLERFCYDVQIDVRSFSFIVTLCRRTFGPRFQCLYQKDWTGHAWPINSEQKFIECHCRNFLLNYFFSPIAAQATHI